MFNQNVHFEEVKMRKIISFTLAAIFLFALSSCYFRREKWEDGKQKEVFFDAEKLEFLHLSDIPMPNLENSYLDESTLYLNLSREEYDAYVCDLSSYLYENESIHFKGYKYGTHTEVLLILPFVADDFAPLTEEYPDIPADSHTFCFSLFDTYELIDKCYYFEWSERIHIEYSPTSPKNSDFSYTVRMSLSSLSNEMHDTYDPCYHDHDFSEAVYPIAGTENTVKISTCCRCEEETQSWYASEYKSISVMVTTGNEYVRYAPNWMMSGLLYEVKLAAQNEGELKLFVNGTEIPKTRDAGDYWAYSFIAPSDDAVIYVEYIESK